MINLLASEGGYQAFTLHALEKGWLYFALATGALSLCVSLGLMRNEIERGMKLMGCNSVSQLSRENLRFR